ncbi:MAG: hypothetical protein JWQ35_1923, partial [Bacteriovoracaceae bacterium]|nr:hypothetical protein [Bacteriovoracaceae bacterium]
MVRNFWIGGRVWSVVEFPGERGFGWGEKTRSLPNQLIKELSMSAAS